MSLLLSVLLLYHRISYMYILATALQSSVIDCKSLARIWQMLFIYSVKKKWKKDI